MRVELVGRARHVIVGHEHPCAWVATALTCQICNAEFAVTTCTCAPLVPCPDCGCLNAAAD